MQPSRGNRQQFLNNLQGRGRLILGVSESNGSFLYPVRNTTKYAFDYDVQLRLLLIISGRNKIYAIVGYQAVNLFKVATLSLFIVDSYRMSPL